MNTIRIELFFAGREKREKRKERFESPQWWSLLSPVPQPTACEINTAILLMRSTRYGIGSANPNAKEMRSGRQPKNN